MGIFDAKVIINGVAAILLATVILAIVARLW